jgi:molecular chaperone GrpE (heat shock protein)
MHLVKSLLNQNPKSTKRRIALLTMRRKLLKLHHKLLLKYADAENVRRERVNDVKRRDAQYIAKFGDKVGDIYDSLVKVCDFASGKAAVPNVDEKVKSLTEGLVMTKGLMRNILEKHNIRKNSA